VAENKQKIAAAAELQRQENNGDGDETENETESIFNLSPFADGSNISKQFFDNFLNDLKKENDHLNETILDNFENPNFSNSPACQKFKSTRKYITKPLSYEEQNYPIAYSIVIHKDFQMFERLLRSIYQPQNYYCIHVDQKAPEKFKQAVKQLISCFENVFHPSRSVKVYYLHYSRVEADLECLRELEIKRNYNYKYVFNLCGQDYPLKTNLDIIRDLKGLYGKNEVESVDIEKVGKLGRVLKGYDLTLSDSKDSSSDRDKHSDTLTRNYNKDKKPSNLNYAPSLGPETGLFAGSAYFCFKKAAVKFMLTDQKVLEFFDWMKDGWSPDESIWATLSRYNKLPGSYPSHTKYGFNEVHTRVRLVKWAGLDKPQDNSLFNSAKMVPMYDTCHGRWLRGICVYGAGDVHWLLDSRHWFGNKFDPSVDPVAIDCVDVYLRKKALNDAFVNMIH